MNTVYNEEFAHAITEGPKGRVQNYRILVATDVEANLFDHNKQLFDVAYHFSAQASVGYDTPQTFMERPGGEGYGMVTVYRVPETYEQPFRARVGKLFKDIREGKTLSLHYQESGYVWVYLKKIDNILWAFASDDARNYYNFSDLNPESKPLDTEYMDKDELDRICMQGKRVVRLSGDENSDSGFHSWLFYEASALYRELVKMDIIAGVEADEEQ